MKKRAQDAQTPHTGKVLNDHNKRGQQIEQHHQKQDRL